MSDQATYGATPQEARRKLTALSEELGRLADSLADVDRRLEPVATSYQQFIDDYETGLWHKHVGSEGARLPSEKMRLKLAQQSMDADLLGRYVGLTNSRRRLAERIRNLRAEIEAQRSILSALKTEVEATS